MPLPLAPRPPTGEMVVVVPPQLQKLRKISTACLACKSRKTKCSGGDPCDACGSRSSSCRYDITSDQRRKIANQKNLDELKDTRETLHRQGQLLRGIIATIRAGDSQELQHLISLIKSGVDASQLAAHVRNSILADATLRQTYEGLAFEIDGRAHLPPPSQVLCSPFGQDGRRPPSESLI